MCNCRKLSFTFLCMYHCVNLFYFTVVFLMCIEIDFSKMYDHIYLPITFCLIAYFFLNIYNIACSHFLLYK